MKRPSNPQVAELLRTLARGLRDEALRAAVPDAEPFDVRSALLEAADALAPVRAVPAAAAPSSDDKPSEPLGTAAIAYADGASRGNPGEAGAGALLCDSTGAARVELREYIGRATNNVAEYRALILALREACERGVRHLRVRMDSELVVKQMTGVYRVKHPDLKPLAAEAAALVRRFERFKIEHIPRAKNAEADRLANEAVERRAARR